MKNLLLLLCIGFIFISCEKETNEPAPVAEVPEVPEVGDPSFTVFMDGVEQSYGAIVGKLIIEDISNWDEENRGLRLKTFIGLNTFSVYVKNYEWQSPPAEGVLVKKYNTNVIGESEYNSCGEGDFSDHCDRGNLTYSVYQGAYYECRTQPNIQLGEVEITYIDTINHVVSGNFDAKVYEMFELYPDSIHFNGEFENQPYIIEYWN